MVKSALVIAVICAFFAVASAGSGASYILLVEAFSDASCTQKIGEYRNLDTTGSCPYAAPTACSAVGVNYIIQSCAADTNLPADTTAQFFIAPSCPGAFTRSFGVVTPGTCIDFGANKSFKVGCGVDAVTMSEYPYSQSCTPSAMEPVYDYTASSSTCASYPGYFGAGICPAPPVDIPIAPPVDAPVVPPMTAPVAEPIAEPIAEPMAAPMNTPMATPVAAPVAKTPVRKISVAAGLVAGSVSVIAVVVALI